jgi:hypothetical protein
MDYPAPKDDAWKQAHLAMLERLGKDAWLRYVRTCGSHWHEPEEFGGAAIPSAIGGATDAPGAIASRAPPTSD